MSAFNPQASQATIAGIDRQQTLNDEEDAMYGRLFVRGLLALLPLHVCLTSSPAVRAQQVEVAGVRLRFVEYQGPATFSAKSLDKRSLRIGVDPRSEGRSLTLGVELPVSAQMTWAADVEVVDSNGRPLSARHDGIQWHHFSITVPPQRSFYVVRAVDPPEALSQLFSDEDREVTEPTTGIRATILKWHEGRKAALSIRFDDSHPSHVAKVIPILREYGFRGTFMVCPGAREPNSRRRSDFEEHRAEWVAVAQRGDQEFANHSAHHRGATGDEDMEREIGEASKAIWELFPGKSKLLALNLGGGTTWETSRTLRYYLHKYHLFESSGSLGMDDVYGDRPAAFREHLERHVERGLWCRIHYHGVGERLGASEANFRAAMDIAKRHAPDLWIAGMADIHKYQAERQSAKLEIAAQSARRVLLGLLCFTDPKLYDQRLTIEIALPPAWSTSQVKVKATALGEAVIPTVAVAEGHALRFHALPITAEYVIEKEM